MAQETANTTPEISPPQVGGMRQSDRRLHDPEPLPQAFSETGEPIFRRSVMRLSFPRIKSLQTDDGTASIVFQSTDMNRDTGGFKYLFRFATSAGEAHVRATVDRVTSGPASEKFSADGGKNFWALKSAEIASYVDKYAEEYGNTFEVVIFEVISDTSGSSIEVLRDTFCRLIFDCWSSYRYNNTDETSDPTGRYPDTINCLPYGLDKRFYVTLHAKQEGGHD